MDITFKHPYAPPEEFRALFPTQDRSPWRVDSTISEVVSNPAATFRRFLRSLRKRVPAFSKRDVAAWSSGALACLDEQTTAAMEPLFVKGNAKANKSSRKNGKRLPNAAADLNARSTPSPAETRVLLLAQLLRGNDLDDQTYWNVWQRSLAGFQACEATLDPPEGAEAPADLQFQLSVELRWLAATANRDFIDADRWMRDARRGLSRWLDDHLDEHGIPCASEYAQLPQVLRGLGRCLELADRLKSPLFRNRDRKRIRRFLQTLPSLANSTGQLAGLDAEIPWSHLAQITKRVSGTGHAGLVQYYESLAKGARNPKTLRTRKIKPVPAGRAAFQSDVSSLATLRRSWSPASDACVVTHHAAPVELQLQARGVPVIAGQWTVGLRAGGQPLELKEGWECTCWFSDKDGDFMELQQDLGNGLKHERQIFLSRNDHFLILAECLHSDDPEREVELQSEFSLAKGWKAKRGESTREWTLTQSGETATRIYPLSLEQEITHKSVGESQCADGTFRLIGSGRGALYLPILIDWHPERQKSRTQWRKLTVTENRRVVTDAEAVGYRLRVGDGQWVIYHSQKKPPVPRAMLGLHTLYETVFARLDSKGDVDPELNVE